MRWNKLKIDNFTFEAGGSLSELKWYITPPIATTSQETESYGSAMH